MNEHYYDELINTITSVNDRAKNIPLKYTGLNKKGGTRWRMNLKIPIHMNFIF